MKKHLIVLVLVVFAFSSMFVLASCAKKQMVVGEEEVKAAPEEEAKPAVTETAKEEEEAKLERLKELEEAKKAEAIEEKEIVEERAVVEEKVEEKVEEAAPAFDEKEAYRERMAAQVEAESIFFDFDRSFIKPEYRPILEKKAKFLKEFPEYSLRIEGNCDERGTNEYNLALGDRRADSAKNYLISQGLSADRIATISYGEERPLALGHNEEAWAQNRRDDFVLIR
ncbi:MAG: peptidoglycan-associated lipoprotein Pal [Thermodesulfobacteriota bacterium]